MVKWEFESPATQSEKSVRSFGIETHEQKNLNIAKQVLKHT